MSKKPNTELLEVLSKLSKLLNNTNSVVGGNLLERWFHFKTHSEAGEECPYARKARELFEKYDWAETEKAIESLIGCWNKTNGDLGRSG